MEGIDCWIDTKGVVWEDLSNGEFSGAVICISRLIRWSETEELSLCGSFGL